MKKLCALRVHSFFAVGTGEKITVEIREILCYSVGNERRHPMKILYMLQSIRMPVLNEIMLLITQFGEETAFLVTALIVFWCVDKKKGYFIMSVGFVTTMFNQVLKMIFRIPRPWVLDQNFTILEEAREAATGYSFPSGHSQSAVGTFGGLASVTQNRWIRGVCIAIAVLVPVSRMYIGVHTPADVLVGAAISVALIFALRFVSVTDSVKAMKTVIAIMLVIACVFFAYVNFWKFPENVDQHNLESAVKNSYTMMGCLVGVAVVYVGERRFVKFETKAVWWVQILKAVLGLAVVLAVKEGLRLPLESLTGDVMTARAVRYFLIVVTAGMLWPMTFHWFGKLGEKK